MKTTGTYRYFDRIGKYFHEVIPACLHVPVYGLSTHFHVDFDRKFAVSESYVLLFSLQGGRQNSKPRKLSPVIAPNIL